LPSDILAEQTLTAPQSEAIAVQHLRGAGVNLMKQAELKGIAERYAAFAIDEARGSSEAYEKLAFAIAQSADLLAFIATFPVDKRQPNLFLAAVRPACGIRRDVDELRQFARASEAKIREVMLARTMQTNEPGRCAVLLPLLAELAPPLALIEVGASAGLCLLMDHYGYDDGDARIDPAVSQDGRAPVFTCEMSGPAPFTRAIPRIAWRAGLDLNPIDVRSEPEAAWLETLVWPGQDGRVERLRAAIGIARRNPPNVVRGDLLTDLAQLATTAPKNATVVVFVLPQQARRRFAATLKEIGVEWISNEPPGVFPSIASKAPPSPARGRFLMARNDTPVAWSGPHGQSLDWFGVT